MTEKFRELADQFDEAARDYQEKAENADRSETEAEQLGWTDALDYAAARIRKTAREAEKTEQFDGESDT